MVNFLRFRWIYFFISLTVISAGLFSIVRWGYKFSIDFIGGTDIQYQVGKNVSLNNVRNVLNQEGIGIVSLQKKGDVLFIKTEAIDERRQEKLNTALEDKLDVKLSLLKLETVGPTLGKEMIRKTVIASLLAIVGILLYMSFAFRGFNFAFAAIVALVHDFLVVMGIYSLISKFFGAEIDTLFVTAVLTSMSFSVHDTIVIFDKIREYLKNEGKGNIEYYADKALTETFVRSVNNSMTIIFMLLALTFLGGVTIKFFVITLLIGTITGTYSSPFVATPIVVWLEKLRRK